MDKEFAEVLYRALRMITGYLEKRFGFGGRDVPESLNDFINKKTQK